MASKVLDTFFRKKHQNGTAALKNINW